MFNTPLEEIRYILYKWSQDFDFIQGTPEDVVLERAQRLVDRFIADDYQYYTALRLQKLLEEHVIEHVLLNPSV